MLKEACAVWIEAVSCVPRAGRPRSMSEVRRRSMSNASPPARSSRLGFVLNVLAKERPRVGPASDAGLFFAAIHSRLPARS